MELNHPNPVELPPPLLRLVEKQDRGRALITTRVIKPGQVVMVDTPLLVYPSTLGCLPIFCSRCFRVLPSEPFLCSSCRVAHFCSVRCLSLSHPLLLCHALPSLIKGKTTWPDDIMFLLSAYSLPSRKLLQLLSLHSNSSFPDESIDKLHSELTSLFPANIVPLDFSRKNTSSLISKAKNNSFALINPMDPKYEHCGVAGARAYGLYLWASNCNHDCMPNVCRFDYIDDLKRENNTDFVFRALHEIKEGSEICISYVGVTTGYKERQKMLIKGYGFKYECERCKIESRWKENQEEEGEESEENNERETTEMIEEKNKEDETEKKNAEGTEEEIEAKSEEEIEEKNEEENTELNKKEGLALLDGGEGGFLIADYIKRYICDCGGYLARVPPLQDGVESDQVECNCCGNVIKDESGGAADANS